MTVVRWKRWSKTEETFLKQNQATMSDKEIGEKLGRSERSIHNKRYYKGFRRNLNVKIDDLPQWNVSAFVVDYYLKNGV